MCLLLGRPLWSLHQLSLIFQYLVFAFCNFALALQFSGQILTSLCKMNLSEMNRIQLVPPMQYGTTFGLSLGTFLGKRRIPESPVLQLCTFKSLSESA